MLRPRITPALIGLSFILAAAVPAIAQSEAPAASPAASAAQEADIVVTGVEYAFQDLPTSVPVGTSLGFTNAGAEVHEFVLVRVADDVTSTVEELMTMEEDPMAAGLVEMVGEMPLFAGPGETAPGALVVGSEGRYVALCFIPQGLTDMSLLEQAGPDADPSSLPEEVQAILANPPHAALGMVQEFNVTAPGTTPGPLPAAVDEPAPEGSPAVEASPAS